MNLFTMNETPLALAIVAVSIAVYFFLPAPLKTKLLGIKSGGNRRWLQPIVQRGFLLISLCIGAFMISFLVASLTKGPSVTTQVTNNWRSVEEALIANLPKPERKAGSYWVKEGQTIDYLANRFGVGPGKLNQLNPSAISPDMRITVPPVEQPMQPTPSNGALGNARVSEEDGAVRVVHDFGAQQIITTIPELAELLAKYNAISKGESGIYHLERTISVENNIHVDITPDTLKVLQLKSTAKDVVCLCFSDASVLIKGVEITSFDPTTNTTDTDPTNGRSFVRAKNSRLDIIESRISHLGSDINKGPAFVQEESGTYGITWRVPTSQQTTNIATGWVENSTFSQNYSGAFAQGTAGMTWRNNQFIDNKMYGLSVQSSTGSLVEKNTFQNNGKHGLLLSKASESNLIKGNTISGNKLHGVVVHEGATRNFIEDNIAHDNVDNFVVTRAEYTTLQRNEGYNAAKNNVRINEQASKTYVMDNDLRGGSKAVNVYGEANDTYIASNQIKDAKQVLSASDAKNVLFAHNNIDIFNFEVGAEGDVVLGPNTAGSADIEE
jgi:parallel beta-helix repeat protein